jgi:hypothetical protein
VFGHRPVGVILSGLIPSVGAQLFPFLEDESESIISACIGALHNLLTIDCDALWKPLVAMSGQTIPACPLKGFSKDEVKPVETTLPSKSLRHIANELLLYIESLPEQTLD